eukprot:3941800-Rhodomonas_salina.3
MQHRASSVQSVSQTRGICFDFTSMLRCASSLFLCASSLAANRRSISPSYPHTHVSVPPYPRARPPYPRISTTTPSCQLRCFQYRLRCFQYRWRRATCTFAVFPVRFVRKTRLISPQHTHLRLFAPRLPLRLLLLHQLLQPGPETYHLSTVPKRTVPKRTRYRPETLFPRTVPICTTTPGSSQNALPRDRHFVVHTGPTRYLSSSAAILAISAVIFCFSAAASASLLVRSAARSASILCFSASILSCCALRIAASSSSSSAGVAPYRRLIPDISHRACRAIAPGTNLEVRERRKSALAVPERVPAYPRSVPNIDRLVAQTWYHHTPDQYRRVGKQATIRSVLRYYGTRHRIANA